MAHRTVISMTLSAASIDRAIKEIRAYREDFKAKCEQFRKMVGERIGWSASSGFHQALVEDVVHGTPDSSDVEVIVSDEGNVTVVFAKGKDAVFIEFGAGVYNNGAAGSSPHPWGAENGYLIGEYGKGYGKRNAWAYPNSSGEKVITRGTPAAMPMYRGVQETIRALDEIIREVFGS